MEQRSDQRLVTACLHGEEAAWNALIERYAPLIWGILHRCGIPSPDAEDLFQNVCIKLYTQLYTLQKIERLAGWLAAITRQEAAGWARRRQALPDVPETLPDNRPSPEEAAITEERLFLLRNALAALPEPCHGLLTRLYSENPSSYADLSEELDIPLGSIGPRRARCLERLRKLLGE
ncbi:MAG: sigma-70 family RNA polymerase sigma factor [Armatimonas sp.]